MTSTTLRKWNAELNRTALADAGGKGAQLGELARAGVPVPPGFLITTEAYNTFVETNHLQTQIRNMAARVDDAASAEAASEQIRALFAQAAIPGERADEIRQAYQRLAQPDGEAVAVRSSATAADLPTASFAGQHDTPLTCKAS